jgi:4-hydroxy-tetrahydrodipicolinate synthase
MTVATADQTAAPNVHGIGQLVTAMATPFTADGALDRDGVTVLTRHLIDTGTTTVLVNGTTGESPTLHGEEAWDLLALVKAAAADDATVMMGVGSNDTAKTCTNAKRAYDAGADSVLVVSPYYNKPDQRGLLRHFTAVADATPLPLVLYDIPGRTAAIMHVDTIAELAQIPQIVGVKDATGDLAKALDVAHATANTPSGFALWSGADEVNLPLLAAGAFGVISVAAHLVGPLIAEMIRVFPTDPLRARELQLRCMPLHRALFAEPSPAPLKAGLAYKGLPAGPVRAPLADASEAVTQRIQAVLDALTDTV